MKQAARQIGACALGLILICIICRFAFFRSYTAYVPVARGTGSVSEGEAIRAEAEVPGILSFDRVEMHDDFVQLSVRPEGKGTAWVSLQNEEGAEIAYHGLYVDRFNTVFDLSTGGFTGDGIVLAAITVFWGLVGAIMIWHYFQAKGASFYSYITIYFSGFSLFAIANFVTMIIATVSHLTDPDGYSMMSVYGSIQGASKIFMTITTPLVLCFALAMAFSNLALLRHATPRIQNVLGLLVSLLLIAGEAVGWYLFSRNFMGPEWEYRLRNTAENVYATAFVYFECMLAGAVNCGIHATRREPDPDKDFIVILGCWFRRDGSLPPLLKGRVDRAVSFWRKQKEMTGKEAVMIPSGGQGKNETMPEAEAMRRYLISQGIPEKLILPETQSANTWQNMDYSRKIIENTNPEGKVIFSTTNYHVFRSGIWAQDVGLEAEGIGSRTVWWYWPNAFMRECAGLLRKRWKQEILLLLLLIAFFSALTMILG